MTEVRLYFDDSRPGEYPWLVSLYNCLNLESSKKEIHALTVRDPAGNWVLWQSDTLAQLGSLYGL